jgi:hypothetical protein
MDKNKKFQPLSNQAMLAISGGRYWVTYAYDVKDIGDCGDGEYKTRIFRTYQILYKDDHTPIRERNDK